jgi:hypothetical protein
MPRPPDHPSGAKLRVCVRIPPAHYHGLVDYATSKNMNLAEALEKLIERAGLVEEAES